MSVLTICLRTNTSIISYFCYQWEFSARAITLINRMLLIIVALTFFTVDMKVDIHIKSVKAEVVKEIIVLSSRNRIKKFRRSTNNVDQKIQ